MMSRFPIIGGSREASIRKTSVAMGFRLRIRSAKKAHVATATLRQTNHIVTRSFTMCPFRLKAELYHLIVSVHSPIIGKLKLLMGSFR